MCASDRQNAGENGRATGEPAGAATPQSPGVTGPERAEPHDAARLLHELQVQQVELQAQNAELRQAYSDLEASRTRYAELFEGAPVGYLVLSAEGLILEANLTAATLLGTPRSALLHQPIARFVCREDQDTDHLRRQQLLSSGEPQVYDLRMRRPDGEPLWAHLVTSADRGADGAPTFRVALTDVSEAKRAAEALAEQTRLNQVLLDSMPCVALLIRPSTREIVAANAEALKVGAAPGNTCYATWGQRHNPCPWCLAPELWATGQAQQVEVEALGIVWDAHWLPVGPDLYMHYAFDVTAHAEADRTRAQTEDALRESEARLKGIIFSMGDWVWEVDENGVYTYSSRQGSDILGRSAEEIIGKTPFDFMPADEAQRVGQVFADIVARKAPIRDLVNWNIASDGSRVCLLTNGVPILDEQGALKGYRGVDKDITDRVRTEDALRESEERFRSLSNASLEGIMVHERGVILDANLAFARLFGYDQPEELVGKTGWDMMMTPESRERILQRMQRQEKGPLELVAVRRDGSTFDAETESQPVRYLGRDARIVSCRDISARAEQERRRARAEEALAQERHLMGLLMDTLPDHIYFKDRDSRIVRTNKAHAVWLGLADPSEALGKTDFDFFTPVHAQQAFRDEQEIIRTGQPLVGIEEKETWPDGRETWASTTKMPLRDRDGHVVGTFGVSRDITAHKRSDEKLRQSEYLFKGSQRAASIGSYITDFGTGRWESSEVLDQIFGIDATYDRSVQGWLAIVHPDDVEMMDRYLQDDVIGQRRPFDKDYRIVRRSDGAARWVHGLGEVSFDAQGNLVEMIGTIQDITERVEAEERRLRADQERGRLEEQLQQAQKLESVGRLAGGVAHDFNNMLTVIMGHTEMALAALDPSSALYGDLQEVLRSAQRSADLTRQLLAFARRQTIMPKMLDLNDNVEGMLKMLRRLIGEDIALLWRPSTHLWAVKMDPAQLDQILANLCVNARDAISGVGQVTIETSRAVIDADDCAADPDAAPGEYVLLAVSDTGCGMDEATLGKIFEPFFTTKGVGQGTGLGLATVYGAVKQNGGFITVASQVGHGTTFRIYLPRDASRDAASDAPAHVEPPTGNETVLLVEDESALLMLAQRMLLELGYSVLATEDPHQALQVAQEFTGQIDLLMTDVVMPGLSGRDLCQEVVAVRPGLPCLFMSGYTADVIARLGVLDPGLHYLQKPFTRETLAFALREALDQPPD